MHVFKVINYTTTNKFRFNSIFDISHLLPNTSTHFAIKIFSICCTPISKKVQDCVSACSKALTLHWNKAFGKEPVFSHVIVIYKYQDTFLSFSVVFFQLKKH